MSVGILMLVHTALDRAEQVARHWAAAGCPVVIHVDKRVPHQTYDRFVAACADQPLIVFCKRHRCEWGMWGIVAASQSAAELMLARFEDVGHVYLSSGSCLPLRPVQELKEYLAARPRTDFIESATTADVPWTVGGLDSERFTLRFPFSWKKRRALFDGWVNIQRRLRVKRRIPKGIVPHMGSQWWCLTRQTLSAILQDPNRAKLDAYFRRVWIPDESYFQTLVRVYSTHIESRSLTLSKFDYQGKPHVFYDDHLQLLRRSDCFVARKIWPHAEKLYSGFLRGPEGAITMSEPNPAKIDRVFSKAVARRTKGRPGLYMQSRFPNEGWEHGMTSGPYSAFHGFAELFEDFELWLARSTGAQVHGHIYAPEGAEFEGRQPLLKGALSDAPKLRDHNPVSFLTNLLWNTRGARQCFQVGPRDKTAPVRFMGKDSNAQISVISGAWAIPLFKSNMAFDDIRRKAARLQKIESAQLNVLRKPNVKARVRIWTLAEFIEAPMEPLQMIVDEIGTVSGRPLSEAPHMVDLTGFGQFLQNLKNQGMHPYLMGDFPVTQGEIEQRPSPRKPYLVKSGPYD